LLLTCEGEVVASTQDTARRMEDRAFTIRRERLL
jgi:hypothetical protein